MGLLADACRARDRWHDATDWIVTMLFYVACLYVKAYERGRGHDFQSHEDRNQWLAVDEHLSKHSRYYQLLFNASKLARYDGVRVGRGRYDEIRDAFEKLIRVLARRLHDFVPDPPVVAAVDPFPPMPSPG